MITRMFLMLLVLSSPAASESLTFRWSHPTERENGEPLTVAELDSYYIEIISGDNKEVVAIPATQTRATISSDRSNAFAIYVCDTAQLCSETVTINPTRKIQPPERILLR